MAKSKLMQVTPERKCVRTERESAREGGEDGWREGERESQPAANPSSTVGAHRSSVRWHHQRRIVSVTDTCTDTRSYATKSGRFSSRCKTKSHYVHYVHYTRSLIKRTHAYARKPLNLSFFTRMLTPASCGCNLNHVFWTILCITVSKCTAV